MDRDELLREIEVEQELELRKSKDVLSGIVANPRQLDFIHSASKETMMTGANQAGKSTALMIKFTYHLTGKYPEGYKGVRFDHPITAAMGGETAQSTRDLLVNRLLGSPDDRGSGYLPYGSFDPEADIVRMTGGVANQIDYFKVKHFTEGVFDGYSHAYVFSYSTGWRRLQGYSLDLVAIDEEPDMMVYEELSARTNATGGYVDIAMTPLRGETELYLMFEESTKPDIKTMINYDITAAHHMAQDQRDLLLRKYEGNPLAEARLYGRPVRSTGLIYSTPQPLLSTGDFKVPDNFKQIIGIDLAWTVGQWAIVKLALDPQSGMLYCVSDFKKDGMTVSEFASCLRGMGGKDIPVAWPHDAMRQTSSGTVVKQLRDLGINVLQQAAYMVDPMTGTKTKALMSVIEECSGRMSEGRFLFMEMGSRSILAEMRRYRHDRGKVAPQQNDHCIDAMHKAVMSLRYARPVGSKRRIVTRRPEPDFFGD